jgi:Skp family chaperone for outer membrane proteins
MMSNQEKFKKLQEATRARKAREAGTSIVSSKPSGPGGSSIPPTPTPSATSSAAASPQAEVVGEKRGPGIDLEDVERPPKNPRVGNSSMIVDGLHRLEQGVPAQRFILPATFSHGGNFIAGSTEVIIPEVDQVIMNDMGPESLGNVIAEASVASMKLLEVANFLNQRERQFVEERSTMEKKMQSMEKSYKKMDAELKKARLSFRELETNYAAYKDKYQLQVELTQTLASKEAEVEDLSKEKEGLIARVAELEGQLQKLSIPDEEEKREDPHGEFTNISRGSLIKQLMEAQSSAVDMATSSFQNVVAQVQILNAGVELKLDGLDECKEVFDGVIRTPPPAPIENPQ